MEQTSQDGLFACRKLYAIFARLANVLANRALGNAQACAIRLWHAPCYRSVGLRTSKGTFSQPINCSFKESVMRKLRNLWVWLVGVYAMMLCFMPTVAMAKKALRNVVIVADTRKLDGLTLWWAQMYNDSHLYFMILTIIIIPITGCIFGVLADVVMNHIGIDLKHRKAAE
jgi:hypothetical protein